MIVFSSDGNPWEGYRKPDTKFKSAQYQGVNVHLAILAAHGGSFCPAEAAAHVR
jgi:hypothetical protein